MSTNGFSKPAYVSSGPGNYWSIKNGHNVYRILPPMKSHADANPDGRGWFNYVGIHFGWYGVDSKDQTKTRLRTFRCIKKENRRAGTVEQECPACDLIKERKDAFDQKKAALVAAGKPDDQIATELASDEAWIKQFNLDWKCYVNAMNANQEFGSLKMNHKFHKKSLDAKIASLVAMDIDPLDLEQGVWFDFIRTTNDGNDALEIVQEKVDAGGRTAFVPKGAPIDEALATRALSECQDLADIGWELSYDQIKTLVECSGEPEDVDKAFGGAQKPQAAKPAISVSVKSTPAPVTAKPVATPAADVKPVNDAAAIQARLDAIKAKKAAEAQANADKEAAAKAPAAKNIADMSDEEFLAFAGGASAN